MHPWLHLGALRFPTYSFVYGLALLITGIMTYVRLQRLRDRVDPAMIGPALILVLACGFAGAYIIGVIPSAIDSIRAGRLMWTGEANFAGTLTASTLAAFLIFRHDRATFLRAVDLGGVPSPLMQSLGRIGCWAAGCCYGIATDSPLAMYLRNAHGQWAWRYPTQLMSGVANLLIFAVLLIVERIGIQKVGHQRTWPYGGFIYGLRLLLFCVERFSMEFIRGDRQPLLGPLSWVHLYTLTGFVAVSIWMIRLARQQQAPLQ